MLLLSSNVSAQTQEELEAAFLAHAAEMRLLCSQMQPPVAKCFVVTEFVDVEVIKEVIVEVPGECPDPLAATRVQLETASQNLGQAIIWLNDIANDETQKAKDALDAVLGEYPLP